MGHLVDIMKVLLVDDIILIPVVTSITNIFFNHRRVFDPAQIDTNFDSCMDYNTIYYTSGSIDQIISNCRNCFFL